MTGFQQAATYFFFVVAGALSLKAALTDVREYKIRNGLVLALATLFIVYAVLVGQWSSLRWDLAIAVFVFVLLFIFFALGWVGGGDVKILPVAFLWTGASGALPFTILLALFCSLHALAAKLGWAKSQTTESGRQRIPFAPSVAAALIGTLVLRSFQLT